ncbi:bifunctional DNA primase/polymerase [Facklamia sp. P13069]|uniref:bifunctional DNA primase/polymerase n=1 Tax=Facklamia sp. P13069 TaxID=3421954 RepID=UPI003D1700E0
MDGYRAALLFLEEGLQTVPLDKNKKPILSFRDLEISKIFIEKNKYAYSKVTALGALTRGIWCIDIDVHGSNGYESLKDSSYYEELKENLKKTLVQKTPSGGLHIIFKKRECFSYGQKINYLDGVDIKAHDNNYFVIGGSVTSKGKYEITNVSEPKFYEGEFESLIFSNFKNYKDQMLSKYSIRTTLKNYDLSHLGSVGSGLGKQAYERILARQSTERNNDLYLASTYAKQCGVSLEPLRVLIGDNKNGGIFTESEWIATVNSANSN